ncbi:MerR family transcriptional regulator [Domibacillus robiginosus]|uniref:MerR family transcriptional regulator n=1 Tax=Domibacillus robiginosus TaxID=1071054 RepID=UPI00155A4A6F|nr:MerR family transcriptional regulator [Domibacillus robiginosus]
MSEFSKLCGTSVKTLCYYSDIGLLKPSYIDHLTNHWYYSHDKIQTINKINLLKSCDISVLAIKELVETGNENIIKWKVVLERKITELEGLKKHIAWHIQEMDKLKQRME